MFRAIASSRRALGLLCLFAATAASTLCSSTARAVDAEEQKAIIERYKQIKWVVGPGTGDLGNAKINVPQGYRFCGADGAQAFSDYTQNIYSGELGVLMPTPDPKTGKGAEWFILFSFEDAGYVKDDDKDELTSEVIDGMLEGYRKGTEAGNADLRARGWATLSVTGWHQKPFYDQTTKNLTWAIIVAGDGSESVNYDSRVLGRRGFMTVKMVLDKEDVAATVPQYQKLVGGLKFNSGESYAEYKQGDKLATYGLVGLLGGGAAGRRWRRSSGGSR